MKISTVCGNRREKPNISEEIIKSTMNFRTAPILKYSVRNPGAMLIILILFSHSQRVKVIFLNPVSQSFAAKVVWVGIKRSLKQFKLWRVPPNSSFHLTPSNIAETCSGLLRFWMTFQCCYTDNFNRAAKLKKKQAWLESQSELPKAQLPPF